jgi:hypothetical protein
VLVARRDHHRKAAGEVGQGLLGAEIVDESGRHVLRFQELGDGPTQARCLAHHEDDSIRHERVAAAGEA